MIALNRFPFNDGRVDSRAEAMATIRRNILRQKPIAASPDLHRNTSNLRYALTIGPNVFVSHATNV